MTSLVFHAPDAGLPADVAARLLARWRHVARELPAKRAQEYSDSTVAATVVHHGILRCSGIAVSADAAAVLVIAGSHWLEPNAEVLATPAQALAHLLQASTPGGSRGQLHGNFSYVLFERAARRTTAECGGFGVVPLYYSTRGGGLSIASDLKFLLPIASFALNREGAAEFLTLGHLVSDATLLEGVKRLLPSTRLIAEGGHLQLQSPSWPAFRRDEAPTAQTFDRLDGQFERAIRRYSADIRQVSVSLSGGIDSRTTLLAARRVGLEVLPWTAGEPGSLECKVARMVCDREGVALDTHENQGCRLSDWFERAVWYTEARCPPGHMHFFDAGFSGAIRPGAHLHGLIGDVVVGGDYDVAGEVPTQWDALQRFCQQHMQSLVYWPEGSWQRIGLREWISSDTHERVAAQVMSRCPRDDAYSTFLWSRYQQRGFGFIIPALASQISPWGDILTPFIDPAFFATCASISRTTILDRRAQLAWAVRRYPELVGTPRVKDGVLLPMTRESTGNYDRAMKRFRRLMQFRYYVSRLTGGQVNLRQSEGYPFYASWYRKCDSVRNYFDEVLLSEASLARGLWTRAGIEHLLRDLRVGRNVWDAAGSILMLETFARLFVDRTGEGVG